MKRRLFSLSVAMFFVVTSAFSQSTQFLKGDYFLAELNQSAAFNTFKKGSDAGYTDCSFALSHMYLVGVGTAKDPAKALSLIKLYMLQNSEEDDDNYFWYRFYTGEALPYAPSNFSSYPVFRKFYESKKYTCRAFGVSPNLKEAYKYLKKLPTSVKSYEDYLLYSVIKDMDQSTILAFAEYAKEENNEQLLRDFRKYNKEYRLSLEKDMLREDSTRYVNLPKDEPSLRAFILEWYYKRPSELKIQQWEKQLWMEYKELAKKALIVDGKLNTDILSAHYFSKSKYNPLPTINGYKRVLEYEKFFGRGVEIGEYFQELAGVYIDYLEAKYNVKLREVLSYKTENKVEDILRAIKRDAQRNSYITDKDGMSKEFEHYYNLWKSLPEEIVNLETYDMFDNYLPMSSLRRVYKEFCAIGDDFMLKKQKEKALKDYDKWKNNELMTLGRTGTAASWNKCLAAVNPILKVIPEHYQTAVNDLESCFRYYVWGTWRDREKEITLEDLYVITENGGDGIFQHISSEFEKILKRIFNEGKKAKDIEVMEVIMDMKYAPEDMKQKAAEILKKIYEPEVKAAKKERDFEKMRILMNKRSVPAELKAELQAELEKYNMQEKEWPF